MKGAVKFTFHTNQSHPNWEEVHLIQRTGGPVAEFHQGSSRKSQRQVAVQKST